MKKLLSTTLALGLFVYTSIIPCSTAFALSTNAMPDLASATNGSVSTSGTNMNVSVDAAQGGSSVYNWKSFNVGSNSNVNFQFNNIDQTALNRVQAAGGMSQIYGNITNSGIGASTGKIFLLNPNGVFFGSGSSVNVNSFTASTFDGTYNEALKKLELNRNGSTGNIYVNSGSTIYGANGVNLVGNNVTLYKDSLVSTAPGTGTVGGVKIVTGDGVNFTFVSGGASNAITSADVKTTTNQNTVTLNGTINASNAQVYNASTNAASAINLKNSVMKATKMVYGTGGLVELVSNSRIIADTSKFEGDNVKLDANGLVSLNNVEISGGAASAKSATDNVLLNNSKVETAGDFSMDSANIASVQGASTISAKDVTVKGTSRAQIVNGTITATGNVKFDTAGKMILQNGKITADGDVTLSGDAVASVQGDSIVNSKGNVTIASKNGHALIHDANVEAGETLTLNAGNVASIQGGAVVKAKNIALTAVQNAQTSGATLTATNDITLNSTAKNAMIHNSTATAGGNMTLTAANIASIQGNSTAQAKAVTLTGTTRAQISTANVTATDGDIKLVSSNGSAYINNATVKALNGDITLDAADRASVQANSTLTAKNVTVKGAQLAQINGSTVTATGDVLVKSPVNAQIANATVKANNVNIESDKLSMISGSTVNADNAVSVKSGETAFIQKTSKVNAKDITVDANSTAQITDSELTATNNINVFNRAYSEGSYGASLKNSKFTAGNAIAVDSQGSVYGVTNTMNAKDITVKSATANLTLDKTNMTATNDINLDAAVAYKHTNSTVNATNSITAKSGNSLVQDSITGSTLTAKKINLESTKNSVKFTDISGVNASERTTYTAYKNVELAKTGDFVVDKMDIKANDAIKLTSTTGSVDIQGATFTGKTGGATKFDVTASKNITNLGQQTDVNGLVVTMNAGGNVNVNIKNASDREKGITVNANNITLESQTPLSVSSLIAKNDLTIVADSVLAGKPYTSELPVDAQGNPRSLMSVGGTFTSTGYTMTGSYYPTTDGLYNQRHHIQYGTNGEEKILLINPRPIPIIPNEPEPELPDVVGVATMVNKIPLAPEAASRLAQITDNRSAIVDVFAAASQIEIADDDEQKQ